jgi:hypothetical protein
MGSAVSLRLVSPWWETTGGSQAPECESEGVLSAHGDALSAGLIVEAVSQFFPCSGQVGGPHDQAGPAAGNVGEPRWRHFKATKMPTPGAAYGDGWPGRNRPYDPPRLAGQGAAPVRMRAAMRSATMTAVRCVLARGMTGMMEASATRTPSTPITLP